uniref:NADH-ubiquinone oxidoreductase chain 3 n=1 Tax=Panulirus versicolor TaxID=150436 RepID=I1WZ63_PANVR|nr:NADH dehydrogenase subunit 3 [Panulirus versicolor]AFI72596.1 NADH dehydrogenase subunit 3 [Panulirus versicolor]AGA56070.1 NADH dehydrogenase subunit 3 [Panulirus versicolor]
MFLILFISLVTLIISFILLTIASIISKKTIIDREKMSPFECGFDPKGSARIPFSLKFFLIAVIFLIFDVEITLLLPLVCTMNLSNLISWSSTGLIFLWILLLGLYLEWHSGALEWSQ